MNILTTKLEQSIQETHTLKKKLEDQATIIQGLVPTSSIELVVKSPSRPHSANKQGSVVLRRGRKIDGVYVLVDVHDDGSIRAFSRRHNTYYEVLGFPGTLTDDVFVAFIGRLEWFRKGEIYMLASNEEVDKLESSGLSRLVRTGAPLLDENEDADVGH